MGRFRSSWFTRNRLTRPPGEEVEFLKWAFFLDDFAGKMAEGTTNQERRGGNMPRQSKNGIRILRVKEDATGKEILAKYRKEFTAADLQKYTEIEPMVPMEQVLAE